MFVPVCDLVIIGLLCGVGGSFRSRCLVFWHNIKMCSISEDLSHLEFQQGMIWEYLLL